MVIRKMVKVPSEACYREVVSGYLDYACENLNFLGAGELSELLRYSVCVCLGLNAVLNLPDAEGYAEGVVRLLQPIFDKYHVPGLPRERRMAMLEACVHCIEFSRRRLEEKERHG